MSWFKNDGEELIYRLRNHWSDVFETKTKNGLYREVLAHDNVPFSNTSSKEQLYRVLIAVKLFSMAKKIDNQACLVLMAQIVDLVDGRFAYVRNFIKDIPGSYYKYGVTSSQFDKWTPVIAEIEKELKKFESRKQEIVLMDALE